MPYTPNLFDRWERETLYGMPDWFMPCQLCGDPLGPGEEAFVLDDQDGNGLFARCISHGPMKAAIRKLPDHDEARWMVWIPPVGPESFEGGDIVNGAILDPWGDSEHASWDEACEFVQRYFKLYEDRARLEVVSVDIDEALAQAAQLDAALAGTQQAAADAPGKSFFLDFEAGKVTEVPHDFSYPPAPPADDPRVGLPTGPEPARPTKKWLWIIPLGVVVAAIAALSTVDRDEPPAAVETTTAPTFAFSTTDEFVAAVADQYQTIIEAINDGDFATIKAECEAMLDLIAEGEPWVPLDGPVSEPLFAALGSFAVGADLCVSGATAENFDTLEMAALPFTTGASHLGHADEALGD